MTDFAGKQVVLGIDTSNYKTSVALVSREGKILCNLQRFLDVKKGERGLRQSVALFQHVNRLPELLEEAFGLLPADAELSAASVSSKPRPVEGSYMPVFLAGLSAARTVAAARGIPLFTFSHQEGHVEAVRFGSPLAESERFLSFHFSGGTSECLLAEEGKLELAGGSRDLAFGQVLDRVGVAMGFDFPCGQELDKLAVKAIEAAGRDCPPQGFSIGRDGRVKGNPLPKIKCADGIINLSGIETKCQRMLRSYLEEDSARGSGHHRFYQQLSVMLLDRICQAMADQTEQLAAKYGVNDALFAGGVSSSSYIRACLPRRIPGIRCVFGDPALSCDNAVGTALLGGRKLWH